MLDWFYLTGWGAFGMLLFMVLPFAAAFLFIVFTKSAPSRTSARSYRRMEFIWIGFVVAVFVLVNVASINYMPTVATARANANPDNVVEVKIEAESWSFDISGANVVVGQPVRFSGISVDTMHSFAIYHPNGKVLFTMMLMPGTAGPTSLVHTFTEPGTYTVRCLEYCGIAHHDMNDEIVVSAAAGQSG